MEFFIWSYIKTAVDIILISDYYSLLPIYSLFFNPISVNVTKYQVSQCPYPLVI